MPTIPDARKFFKIIILFFSPGNKIKGLREGVHRLAACFILRRLKRPGFSNCRVDVAAKGLVVYAQR